MKKSTKIITAALVGVAAGVVTGILLAPDSGRNTRKKLRKQSDKLKGNVKDLTQMGKEKLEELRKNGKAVAKKKG